MTNADHAEKKSADKTSEVKTSEHAKEGAVIGKDAEQSTFVQAHDKAHANDHGPSETHKALDPSAKIDSFGLKMDDGSVLTSKSQSAKTDMQDKVTHDEHNNGNNDENFGSGAALKALAKDNKALEPVLLYRQWAESLPDSDTRKQSAIENSRDMGAQLSPALAALYRPDNDANTAGTHQTITEDLQFNANKQSLLDQYGRNNLIANGDVDSNVMTDATNATAPKSFDTPTAQTPVDRSAQNDGVLIASKPAQDKVDFPELKINKDVMVPFPDYKDVVGGDIYNMATHRLEIPLGPKDNADIEKRYLEKLHEEQLKGKDPAKMTEAEKKQLYLLGFSDVLCKKYQDALSKEEWRVAQGLPEDVRGTFLAGQALADGCVVGAAKALVHKVVEGGALDDLAKGVEFGLVLSMATEMAAKKFPLVGTAVTVIAALPMLGDIGKLGKEVVDGLNASIPDLENLVKNPTFENFTRAKETVAENEGDPIADATLMGAAILITSKIAEGIKGPRDEEPSGSKKDGEPTGEKSESNPTDETAPEGPTKRPADRPDETMFAETGPKQEIPEHIKEKLPDRKGKGKTTGIFVADGVEAEFISQRKGPAQSMPKDSPGFDGYTRTHAEGHAAAFMREHGIMKATLYINNQRICPNCDEFLSKMLPKGAELDLVLPDGTTKIYRGK